MTGAPEPIAGTLAPGPRSGPTALSGLGSTASRATMVLVWVGFAIYVLGTASQRGGYSYTAFTLLLAATWLITAVCPEPLRGPRPWIVLALAATASVLAMLDRDLGAVPLAWLMTFTGYHFAFVAIRGRALLAVGAYLVTVVLVAATPFVVPGANGSSGWSVAPMPESVFSPTAMVLAVAWRALLVRVQRRIESDEAARSASDAEQARTAEAIRVRRAELTLVLAEAGGVLERVAAGAPDVGDGQEARVVEARLRDRFRAPRLAVDSLLDRAAQARRRGATVLLMDDGDPDVPVAREHLAAIERELELAGAGQRVTVRLTPPGQERHEPTDNERVGTVLVSDAAASRLVVLGSGGPGGGVPGGVPGGAG